MDDGRKSDDRVQCTGEAVEQARASGGGGGGGKAIGRGNAVGETRPGRSAGQGALSELDRVRRWREGQGGEVYGVAASRQR